MKRWFKYIQENDPSNYMAEAGVNTVEVEDEAITTVLDVSNNVDRQD